MVAEPAIAVGRSSRLAEASDSIGRGAETQFFAADLEDRPTKNGNQWECHYGATISNVAGTTLRLSDSTSRSALVISFAAATSVAAARRLCRAAFCAFVLATVSVIEA